MNDYDLLDDFCRDHGISSVGITEKRGTQFSEGKLITLDLSNQKLTSIIYNFSRFDQLSTLDISYNNLKSLKTLNGLDNLTELDIKNNPKLKFSSTSFNKFVNLIILRMESNTSDPIPLDLFKPLSKLSVLNIKSNGNMNGGIFSFNNNLRSLTISTPQVISESIFTNLNLRDLTISDQKRILPGTFDSLSHLVELRLIDNEFKQLPVDLFQNLTEIKILDLSHNYLKKIEEEHLIGLSELEELDLTNNKLNSIPENLILQLPSLAVLSLGNNTISSINIRGLTVNM